MDAFEFLGTPVGLPTLRRPSTWRPQETDRNITYLGYWSDSGDTAWQASGNSFKSTAQPGAAAVVEFTGTAVTPVLRTTPWYGKAKLTLDPGTPGEETQTIDLYSASMGWKVTGLYSKTAHRGRAHPGHREHASTDGKAIGVDAFDITGYLDQAQAVTKIDDKDPGPSCSGPPDWSHWRQQRLLGRLRGHLRLHRPTRTTR